MNQRSIIKRIIYAMNPKNISPKMVRLWIFWIIFNVGLVLLPKDQIEGTLWILVPLAGLFIYALVTKDVLESLLMGTISMYLMWHKGGFIDAFVKDLTTNLQDEETIGMYMSFFLCAGIIIALERSGVVRTLSNVVISTFGKKENRVLGTAAIYAGVMSVDDYVSMLTSGAAFSPLMDAIKKPRLALAYIIRTFGTCVSQLLPFGAWGYFVIYQIADAKNVNGLKEASQIFYQTIPFMFFAFVACILAFLFSIGKFPIIGPMKKAYAMAEKGEQMGDVDEEEDEETAEYLKDPRRRYVSVWNLILPIIAIAGFLVYFEYDAFIAFAFAAAFTGILFVVQGIFTIGEYVQCMLDGFIDVIDMVIILIIGYALQSVMYDMGMEAFVESVCRGIPVASLIPFIFFVFFCFSEYLYSLNYTLYQIAIPVLMVVIPSVGANLPLTLGAIISASLFGANACIVSDLGIVSAKGARVKPYDQYVTSQPYSVIAAVITAVLYLAAGFIFV